MIVNAPLDDLDPLFPQCSPHHSDSILTTMEQLYIHSMVHKQVDHERLN